MRITSKQLRRIIRESIDPIGHEDIVTYLTDKASMYHKSGQSAASIQTLLQDDFMDDFGHQVSIDDYADLISRLARPVPLAGEGQVSVFEFNSYVEMSDARRALNRAMVPYDVGMLRIEIGLDDVDLADEVLRDARVRFRRL